MLCKSTWGGGVGERGVWAENTPDTQHPRTHTPHSGTSDISCKVYVKRCAGKEPQLSVDKSFCGEMPQE